MTDQQNKVLYGIEIKPRVKIAPKATIDLQTPEGRELAMRAARIVMEEHREVLERLAKR